MARLNATRPGVGSIALDTLAGVKPEGELPKLESIVGRRSGVRDILIQPAIAAARCRNSRGGEDRLGGTGPGHDNLESKLKGGFGLPPPMS